MPQSDPIAALVAYLKADTDVSGLVGDNVWAGRVPEGASMPQSSIVIRPYGGGGLGKSGQNVKAMRVMVDCYGASLNVSFQIHLAVRAAMEAMLRVSGGGILLHRAFVSADGISALDPSTDPPWPFTMTTYQVVVSQLGD